MDHKNIYVSHTRLVKSTSARFGEGGGVPAARSRLPRADGATTRSSMSTASGVVAKQYWQFTPQVRVALTPMSKMRSGHRHVAARNECAGCSPPPFQAPHRRRR